MNPPRLAVFALGSTRAFGEAIGAHLGVALQPHEEREFTDGTEEDEDSDDEDLDLDEMMDDDEPEDEDEEADSADDEPASPARSGRPVKAAAKKTTTRPAARPTTTTKKTAKPVRRMRAV